METIGRVWSVGFRVQVLGFWAWGLGVCGFGTALVP